MGNVLKEWAGYISVPGESKQRWRDPIPGRNCDEAKERFRARLRESARRNRLPPPFGQFTPEELDIEVQPW